MRDSTGRLIAFIISVVVIVVFISTLIYNGTHDKKVVEVKQSDVYKIEAFNEEIMPHIRSIYNPISEDKYLESVEFLKSKMSKATSIRFDEAVNNYYESEESGNIQEWSYAVSEFNSNRGAILYKVSIGKEGKYNIYLKLIFEESGNIKIVDYDLWLNKNKQ